MIETPQVVESPAQLVATVHIATSRSKIQQVMGPGMGAAWRTDLSRPVIA